jgi:hypothetical protein
MALGCPHTVVDRGAKEINGAGTKLGAGLIAATPIAGPLR